MHAEARKAEKYLTRTRNGGAVSLLALQKQMAADLMLPLAPGDQLDRRAAAKYIKPNDRLTSRERLEIYSRSYWYRAARFALRGFSRPARSTWNARVRAAGDGIFDGAPLGIVDAAEPRLTPGRLAAPEP